jgi:hypothetical protein
MAVWHLNFFMNGKFRIILATTSVVLIASILLTLHQSATNRLAEKQAQPANKSSFAATQQNQVTLAAAFPKAQIAPPLQPPVAGSNRPQSTAEAKDVIFQQQLALQRQKVAKNLRLLATGGQQYMIDKKVNRVTYSDIVGNDKDPYIGSAEITPAGNESYQDFTIDQNTTQVTQVAPDGSIVTYNL